MDYWSIYMLPVRIRKYFINKLLKKMEKQQEQQQVPPPDNRPQQMNPAEIKRKADILRSFQENIKNK